jgi:hypothetical protein
MWGNKGRWAARGPPRAPGGGAAAGGTHGPDRELPLTAEIEQRLPRLHLGHHGGAGQPRAALQQRPHLPHVCAAAAVGHAHKVDLRRRAVREGVVGAARGREEGVGYMGRVVGFWLQPRTREIAVELW